MAGKSCLVVAHEGSIRSLCQLVEGINGPAAMSLDIEGGVPLIYELDGRLKVTKKYSLTGDKAVAQFMKRADTDLDGKLSFPEFKRPWATLSTIAIAGLVAGERAVRKP